MYNKFLKIIIYKSVKRNFSKFLDAICNSILKFQLLNRAWIINHIIKDSTLYYDFMRSQNFVNIK